MENLHFVGKRSKSLKWDDEEEVKEDGGKGRGGGRGSKLVDI